MQKKNTIESPTVARKNVLQLIQFSLQYCFQGHPRSMISISSEKACHFLLVIYSSLTLVFIVFDIQPLSLKHFIVNCGQTTEDGD